MKKQAENKSQQAVKLRLWNVMNQMTRWNIIAENGRRAPRGAGRGSMELDQGIITKEVTRFRSAGYIAMIG